jgi:protein SCO1/2
MRFSGRFMSLVATAMITTVAASESVSSVDGAADEHAHHHVPALSRTNRTIVNYAIPDVRLIRQDGAVVSLSEELNDGRPIVLSFIYTSCTSVCPLVSHILSELQSKLNDNPRHVHLVSITIDPEQDDPARLREYAKSFNAGPDWQHYTGTLAASRVVQQAFDVYRGNKMDHMPATLIRFAPGAQWTRIEGFATVDQLLAELSDPAGVRAAGLIHESD